MQCVAEGADAGGPLDKDIVNVFNFEFVTPVTPRTPVTVRVHADGAPVVNEPVTIVYRDNVLQMNTDGNGEAKTEFDTPDDSEGLRRWLRPFATDSRVVNSARSLL